MNKLVVSFFALLLVLQGSLFSFPLVFVFLQNAAIKRRGDWIFPTAFVLGIILDSLYLKTLGTTSLFLILFLFAIFTYERKFEIDNLSFIFISSFIGGMILFIILNESAVLLKAFLTSIAAVFLSKALSNVW